MTTNVYIENETKLALNLGKTKSWYQLAFADFQYWAHKAAIPWRAIKPHLEDTLDKARTLWPKALQQLPMADEHKQALTAHWQRLDPDFRIKLHP